MKKEKISIVQSLRNLSVDEKEIYPINKRTTVVNTIQRLRYEGYVIKTETCFDKKTLTAIKIQNPEKS